jgi:acyl-coenzyme A synthetase/AMP-(fatty) acid ligase
MSARLKRAAHNPAPGPFSEQAHDKSERLLCRYLVIKKAWPSSMRTLSGDHERFETTYFKVYPGYYFTGDGCRRDKDGYYWLIGGTHDLYVRSRVMRLLSSGLLGLALFQMPKDLETQL